ncbi:MAG: HD domain-containing protein [Bacteroidales bacterium]|nr:HD domain-containing protein [Bacteroidales bacterium]
MKTSPTNKLKIFNDPVYGFINVPDESIFDLIETSWFQRLRNIKQLGLTHLVYPGALHTRFHHAMGAMYLVTQAIEILRFKGHEITEQEALSLTQAILLHDIGHGPFSHALENVLVHDLNHEQVSELFMLQLHKQGGHNLQGAIDIFKNTHPKKALHQLVAGQLDMDRLDYLNRDSFYTGVSEGVVSWDRIIKMLNISNDQLVIDEKGIYSIEKFIISRRLMYWQVYLHKTVIAAEKLLNSILKRAKELSMAGEQLFATPALSRFLKKKFTSNDFRKDHSLLEDFALIDDYDLQASIKVWATHSDPVLRQLCSNLVNRHLFKIEIQKMPFTTEYIEEIRFRTRRQCKISEDETDYFVIDGITRNNAYDPVIGNIMILSRDGSLTDIGRASDHLNISVLSHPVEKFFLCYPKKVAEPGMAKSR